jgi:hypothetical protein
MRNDSILANQQIFANFEFVGREALVAHRPLLTLTPAAINVRSVADC